MYPSRFFKANSRAAYVTAGRNSYCTSHDGQLLLDDLFVPAGKTVQLPLTPSLQHILMPIAGSALLVLSDGTELALQAGELYQVASGEVVISIRNVYGEETINLLHISLQGEGAYPAERSAISLTAKNQLTRGNNFGSVVTAGVYDSRTKDIYCRFTAEATVLAFIINGSFEVADRLMEFRDGLALWGGEPVDFEALSEDAIILFIEYATNTNK